MLDRTLSVFSLDAFISGVVLPAMKAIGQPMGPRRGLGGAGALCVLGAARTPARPGPRMGIGHGPARRAGLPARRAARHRAHLFGLALRNRGWRITYFGPDTPLDTLADAVRRLEPAAVVLSSAVSDGLTSDEEGLRRVASLAPVWIGGDGASEEIASRVGAGFLAGHPSEAAARLAAHRS